MFAPFPACTALQFWHLQFKTQLSLLKTFQIKVQYGECIVSQVFIRKAFNRLSNYFFELERLKRLAKFFKQNTDSWQGKQEKNNLMMTTLTNSYMCYLFLLLPRFSPFVSVVDVLFPLLSLLFKLSTSLFCLLPPLLPLLTLPQDFN